MQRLLLFGGGIFVTGYFTVYHQRLGSLQLLILLQLIRLQKGKEPKMSNVTLMFAVQGHDIGCSAALKASIERGFNGIARRIFAPLPKEKVVYGF